MVLKLYFDLLSQPSRVLFILLNKCEIPFEEVYVKLRNLEHLTPEFEKINPFKKVPVIEHNNFKLFESVAIVRYIAREFNIPENWYPSTSKEQARVDEYLEWHHENIRHNCSTFFRLHYLQPILTGRPASSVQLLKCEKRMLDSIDHLENIWLNDKPFLVGSEISVADLFAACELEQIRGCGYNPKEGRPRVSKWLDSVAERTSPFYGRAHVSITKLIAAQQKKQASHL